MDIESTLTTILRPHLRFLAADAPLPADAELNKLGLDSMAAIDLLFQIETQIGVQIPDELLTADTFKTLGDLRDTVAKLAPAA
jgi:acyl carrier protein